MTEWISRSRLIDMILPHKCALCGCISAAGYCQGCSKLLPWITHACKRCGSVLTTEGVCGQCQLLDPPISDSIIPFSYQSPVSQHIQNLKYNGQLHFAVSFARVLADRILQTGHPLPDIIIPVPLHWKRMCHRGYNQSAEIARELGKQLNTPVSTRILKRCIHTPAQTGLDLKMRIRNIRHAFQVVRPLEGQNIALVDDVVTTGSTTRFAARALTQAGAIHVSVWAVAKT